MKTELRNRAVFLDRDGTIIRDKGYLFKIEDVEYLPGVKEALLLLQDAGFLLIIVSNQSGIARGYFSEDDCKKLDYWLRCDLEKSGVNITASCFCPHHPVGIISKYRRDCECRKPKLGLFQRAITDYFIDPSQSYAIGDKERDLTCSVLGCTPILVSGENFWIGFQGTIRRGL